MLYAHAAAVSSKEPPMTREISAAPRLDAPSGETIGPVDEGASIATVDRDTPAEAPQPGARQPRQERGERRVCAILDAAATLITECGAEGLTIQALAERARTSKGSLYHFFPDLQSVLCALADRHRAAITRLTESMIADTETDWAALSLDQTVERFVAPLAYLETHPDLLALARAPNMRDSTTRRLSPICELAEHILARRYPLLGERARLLRAATMVAVLDGIVGYSLRSSEADSARILGELRRVLAAYLGSHEIDSPGRHVRKNATPELSPT
jgi:AcrR family transcriptional regulator